MIKEREATPQELAREFAYLKSLKATSRISHLAARVRTLRSAGWEMTSLARGIGVSRQRLYQILSEHKLSTSPADAPQLVDLRESEHDLHMRSDLATVPTPMCDPLRAMWAHVFRDKSAGTSGVSVMLDVTIALLLRRGVPFVRIAECGAVTHRAASERLRRATERHTIPDEVDTEFMTYPTRPLSPPRVAEQAAEPRRMFAVVQVVAASFPRFYTVRDRRTSDGLFMFDPSRPTPKRLEQAGLDEFIVIKDEAAWVSAIAKASPDSSPLYAVPIQWLYVESVMNTHAFALNYFDLVSDFYPPRLRSTILTKFLTEPRVLLRRADPVRWGANS